MDPTLWGILIRYVIVPEVGKLIRANHQMTDEEILAKLPADVASICGVGQGFLDRTRGALPAIMPQQAFQFAPATLQQEFSSLDIANILKIANSALMRFVQDTAKRDDEVGHRAAELLGALV